VRPVYLATRRALRTRRFRSGRSRYLASRSGTQLRNDLGAQRGAPRARSAQRSVRARRATPLIPPLSARVRAARLFVATLVASPRDARRSVAGEDARLS